MASGANMDNQNKCESCGQSLDIQNNLNALKSDNKFLRDRIQELEGEIEHLGGGKLLGNLTTRYYHKPDCAWASKMTWHNSKIFRSHEAASNEGYRPCPACCRKYKTVFKRG